MLSCRIITSALVIFLLASCALGERKPKHFEDVYVRYVDYDCEPIPNKEFVIEQMSYNGLWAGGGIWIDTAISDMDGRFSFSLKDNSNPVIFDKANWCAPYNCSGRRQELVNYREAIQPTQKEFRKTTKDYPLLLHPLLFKYDGGEHNPPDRYKGSLTLLVPLSNRKHLDPNLAGASVKFHRSFGNRNDSKTRTFGIKIGKSDSPKTGNKWSLYIYAGQVNGLLERTDLNKPHNGLLPISDFRGMYVYPADELLSKNKVIKKSFYFKADNNRAAGLFDIRVFIDSNLNVSAYITYDYLVPYASEVEYLYPSERILKNASCQGIEPYAIGNVVIPTSNPEDYSDFESAVLQRDKELRGDNLAYKEHSMDESINLFGLPEKTRCLDEHNTRELILLVKRNKDICTQDIDRLVELMLNHNVTGCPKNIQGYNTSSLVNAIARNGDTSSDALRSLFLEYIRHNIHSIYEYESINSAFESNSNLPVDIQMFIAQRSSSLYLARNPSLDPGAARYLYENAKQHIEDKPSGSGRTIYVEDHNYFGTNKDAALATYRELSSNQNTPSDILLELAKSPDPEIVGRARETLGLGSYDAVCNETVSENECP
jgi:hypothetical protein